MSEVAKRGSNFFDKSFKLIINDRKVMEETPTLNKTAPFSSTQNEECFAFDPVKLLRICAYCILIFVSLAGNLLVIAVTRKNNLTSRKSTHYMIVNMAVADIFLTLYMPRVVSLVYAGFEWQVDGINNSKD